MLCFIAHRSSTRYPGKKILIILCDSSTWGREKAKKTSNNGYFIYLFILAKKIVVFNYFSIITVPAAVLKMLCSKIEKVSDMRNEKGNFQLRSSITRCLHLKSLTFLLKNIPSAISSVGWVTFLAFCRT